MLIWKILVITDIVFNTFASVVLGMAVYRTIKSKKKVAPVYRKYGSK